MTAEQLINLQAASIRAWKEHVGLFRNLTPAERRELHTLLSGATVDTMRLWPHDDLWRVLLLSRLAYGEVMLRLAQEEVEG